jgi:hypothetical protein
MVHVRFEGRSFEVNEKTLDLNTPNDDRAVLRSVARWLGVDPKQMAGYVIDRRPSGHLVVRPEAIYG